MIFCWLGVLGMWRMREPMQALHYLSLPACGSHHFLNGRGFLANRKGQAGWKTLLICLILLAINSVVTHATARAFRSRELGHWQPRPVIQSNLCATGEKTMIWCGAGILILLAIAGFAVVRTRDVTEQVIALGFYGLVTALMFFLFQAPDVALSQITVGPSRCRS